MSAAGSTRELFAQRDFMRLWFARLAGTAASQMLMLALAWQMYELTGSAWDLGLIGLLQFLPALPLALPAGHAVDRYDRSRLLALCLLVQTGLGVLLWVLASDAGGGAVSRGWLLGVSVAIGAVRALHMPAQQALIANLVPAALLPRAMAFGSGGLQAAIIAGPAIGGALYVGGPALTYGVCALLAAAATLLVFFGVHYQQSPAHRPNERRFDAAELMAGLRYVIRRRVLLGAVTLDMMAVLLGGATALLPIFAKDVLHVGPVGLGLLRAAPAAGALLMSIVLTRWPLRRRTGSWMFGAVAVYGVTMLVFAESATMWLSLAALAAGGASDMVSVVIRQTLVQIETPDEMRGRVSAINSLFIGASNQLGEFESGATAAWLGPVGSVLLGGAGTLLVAGLWWRWFPDLSRRDALVHADRREA